jgi:hypothetical protein
MIAKLAFGTAAFLGVATTVGLGVLHGGPGGQPARDGDSPVVAQAKSPDGVGEPERKEKSPRTFDPESSPRKETNAVRLDQAMTRFRAHEPAERLKIVERIAGADKAFSAAKRGDLVAGIVERGAIDAATYVDLSCMVKAKDKNSSLATTIKWLVDDGSMVKKGDRLAELDNSWIREQLQVATLKTNEVKAAYAQAAESLRLVRQDHEIEQRLAAIDVKLAEIDLKDAPKEKKEVLELKVEQASLKLERAKARGRAK